jgi:hypothetical protein
MDYRATIHHRLVSWSYIGSNSQSVYQQANMMGAIGLILVLYQSRLALSHLPTACPLGVEFTARPVGLGITAVAGLEAAGTAPTGRR